MNWIKKGNVVAAAAAAALLAVFGAAFKDFLIKKALIRAGQAAAGAKVEIRSVRARLLAGELVLRGVAVADKNSPLKNLLQCDEAVLRFAPSAALRARIAVPEASLTGLQFGTPRRSSGALRRRYRPSTIERAIQSQLAPKEAGLGALTAPPKAVPAIDPKKLASLRALDDAAARLQGIETRWKAQAPSQELSLELAAVRSDLRQADELRRKDLEVLLFAAGVPPLDSDSFARRLLGPGLARQLSSSLYWIAWIRRHASSSPPSRQSEPPPPRRGVNIEFPGQDARPAVLLEEVRLAGLAVDPLTGRQKLGLRGTLLGLSSNPTLYGKPATLSLRGDGPKGGPRFSVDAAVDQTRKPGGAEAQFHYDGLPLSGLFLGDHELGAEISSGTGSAVGTLRIVGDEWKATILVSALGVALEPRVSLVGPAAESAAGALKRVKKFTATVEIDGQERNLAIRVRSDLGQALADAVKRGGTADLAGRRKAVESGLDAVYAGKAQALRAQADALDAAIKRRS